MKTKAIGDNARLEVGEMTAALWVEDTKVMEADISGEGYEIWGDKKIFYPWGLTYQQKIKQASFNFLLNHGVAMERTEANGKPVDAYKLRDAVGWMEKEFIKIETRVIILAAGKGDRWNNYLDRPKHLIEVDGEPISQRAVRLLKANGVKDIWLAGEYEFEGVQNYQPQRDDDKHDANKYLDTQLIWGKVRTVLLLGDVYYTDKAMHTILNDQARSWRLFGRATPSKAGKDHPEPFGFSFFDYEAEQIKKAGNRAAELFDKHKTGGAGFLYLYRALMGLPDELMDKDLYGENWIDIDDETDDFDTPEDYHRFMEAR